MFREQSDLFYSRDLSYNSIRINADLGKMVLEKSVEIRVPGGESYTKGSDTAHVHFLLLAPTDWAQPGA